MLALIFDKSLKLHDVSIPKRKNGESLIRVKLAGICNTDIEIVKGYMNFKGILGHEFTGIVEESDNKELTGKRVVGEINISCENCRFCYSGLERHCNNRQTLGIFNKDGVFAEFITLPDNNLHVLPEIVSDREAVFVEPLAAALEILEQVHIEPFSEIAVIGDGKLGSLIAQVLKINGNDVTVYGTDAKKLDLIMSFGIKTQKNDHSVNEKYDIVVECSGNPEGFFDAVQMTNPRGTIVLKSTFHEKLELNIAPLIINEISLIGSRCGRFEPAIRHLENKHIKIEPLISEVFPLKDAIEAFQFAKNREVLKVLIEV
ncbi:alcohol dehydrogenase catalytic domain-containing protein [candidate division KSB1 bacterium]